MPIIKLSDNYDKIVSPTGKETLNRLIKIVDNWPATTQQQLDDFRHALEYVNLNDGRNRIGGGNKQRKFEVRMLYELVRRICSYYYSSEVKEVYRTIMNEHPNLYQTGVFLTQKDIDEHGSRCH